MPSPSAMVVFSGAALVLLLIPGPAVLYIVARGAAQGRKAALVSVDAVAGTTYLGLGLLTAFTGSAD